MNKFTINDRVKWQGREGRVTHIYSGGFYANVLCDGDMAARMVPVQDLTAITPPTEVAAPEPKKASVDSTAFIRTCTRGLLKIAKAKRYLTVDEVWKEIGAKPEGIPNQVMGTFMAEAAKGGLISSTKRFRRSARTNGPLKVWKSLVFTR